MGYLAERIKLSLLVHGNGIVENFKNNSFDLYQMYQKSSDDVKNIRTEEITSGGFYFLHYYDKSNWMKWSPVFVVDYKKFDNKVVIFAINFNFIPLEIRAGIFDKFITNEDFEKDRLLKVDMKGAYTELLKVGFEYALMEFNAIQVVTAHKISMNILPRFINSGHPQNKYDPKKLIEIWEAKLDKREQRHKEMMSASIDDFYKASEEILEKYSELKDHILRIRRNAIQFGKRLL
jgi:hypothetical protein